MHYGVSIPRFPPTGKAASPAVNPTGKPTRQEVVKYPHRGTEHCRRRPSGRNTCSAWGFSPVSISGWLCNPVEAARVAGCKPPNPTYYCSLPRIRQRGPQTPDRFRWEPEKSPMPNTHKDAAYSNNPAFSTGYWSQATLVGPSPANSGSGWIWEDGLALSAPGVHGIRSHR